MTVQVEEIRLNLPHIEMAAHIYGPEDGEPVIALHGWLDNAATFTRLAPLMPGLRILALDFAGHGYSAHRPPGGSYLMWDNVLDVLLAAEAMGWKRFSVLGHSMGAIVGLLLAASMPERVERLALIDGLLPYTGEPEQAPEKLGEALRAQLALPGKKKPVYASVQLAVDARMKGVGSVTREAAEMLARRGLMPVSGGYTWRSDSRLTLASPIRLTRAHAVAFLRKVACPVSLILAEKGMLLHEQNIQTLLQGLPYQLHTLAGGHHLHLDDGVGAQSVADCFNPFFANA